jgi:hypothetical protein
VRRESAIIGHMMVGGEDGHGGIGRQVSEPQERIQDAGRRAAILRLADNLRDFDGRELGPVETLMALRDQGHDVRPVHGQQGPAPRLLEQRLATHDPAELLRALITCQLARQGAKPQSVATSKKQRPPLLPVLHRPRE